MLNVPNAKRIAVSVDGEAFAPGRRHRAGLRARARFPHRRAGPQRRLGVGVGQAPAHRQPAPGLPAPQACGGARSRRHAAEFLGPVRIVSDIDSRGHEPAGRRRSARRFGDHRRQPAAGRPRSGASSVLLLQRTRNSGFLLATATEAILEGARRRPSGWPAAMPSRSTPQQGQAWCCTSSSPTRARATCRKAPVGPHARAELGPRAQAGFDALAAEQAAWLADFWAEADVGIDGDDALQQGVRFNQFHLLQSVGRDGRTNIAAKGVTGEGYEGHYFWDTEIYVFPFFLFSRPRSRARCCSTATTTCPRRASGRARWRMRRARSTPGAPSPARSARPISRPAPPSTTSMPTSPIRSACTCWRPATSTSWRSRAPRSCWTRRASGSASAATTASSASASTK
jgi:alpha,alpha-trehalose phosphorylase